MEKEIKCGSEGCQEKAEFFHSRCCQAHFEGRITLDGKYFIECEKCGKFVAWVSL